MTENSDLLKSQIRYSTINDVGNQFDDMKEGVEKELYRFEGAVGTLVQVSEKLELLKAHIDKDFEDGHITQEPDVPFENTMKKWLTRYIDRCKGVVQNLQKAAENQHIQTKGRLQSMETALKMLKNMQDTEKLKAGQIAAIENGQIIPSREREPGVHPGPSLRVLRDEAKALSVDEFSAPDTNV